MKLQLIAAAVAATVLSGCTTTLKVTELDPTTNRFATSTKIPPESIKTSEEFDVDSADAFLFLRTNLQDYEKVGVYFEESIEKFGFFEEVMRKDDFERFLISKELQDEIGDVSGFASLSKAAVPLGDFMFADLELTFDVGYQVTMDFAVYDARSAKELFVIKHTVTNWAGLDGPLFQPVMNEYFDWLTENSTKLQSASSEPVAEAEEAADEAE